MVLDVGPDDVGYLAMPLFHSNSLMVGLAPALVAGASVGPGPAVQRVALPGRRAPLRRHVVQLHGQAPGLPAGHARSGPTTPTTRCGWPTATRARPQVVEAVAKRFGVAVVDVFGSTEGAIALDRSGGVPRGSVGRLRQGIKVVDPDGNERPPRRASTATAGSMNAEECVGEIVNVEGVGPFEGYYRNAEAMAQTTRNGWYWSGDLGYVDERRLGLLRRAHLGLAAGGRRELPRRAHRGHRGPPPRRHAGLGLRRARRRLRVTRSWRRWCCATARRFDPAGFAAWIDAQPDLSPKWRPRYVRLCAARCPPRPPTRCWSARSCTRSSAPTASAATPCSCGAGARTPTGAFGADRRDGAARRLRRQRSRPRPGTCRRSGGPVAHRRPSSASPPRCGRGSRPTSRRRPTPTTWPRPVAWGRAWQAKLAGAGLGGHQLARRVRRPGCVARRGGHLQRRVRPQRRAPARQPGRASTWPAPPCWPTGPPSSAGAGCPPS